MLSSPLIEPVDLNVNKKVKLAMQSNLQSPLDVVTLNKQVKKLNTFSTLTYSSVGMYVSE